MGGNSSYSDFRPHRPNRSILLQARLTHLHHCSRSSFSSSSFSSSGRIIDIFSCSYRYSENKSSCTSSCFSSGSTNTGTSNSNNFRWKCV